MAMSEGLKHRPNEVDAFVSVEQKGLQERQPPPGEC